MTVDLNYLPDGGPGSSNSSLSTHQAAEEMFHWHGCGYLQAIRSHIDNFSTTSGEYLEAIFTHREIFAAYPSAHQGCARGFSDLAQLLEKRPWRADRDSDGEAVSVFRHEAWMIGATSPVIKLAPTTKEDDHARVRPSHVCVLPMM